jgi:hypothetical protein
VLEALLKDAPAEALAELGREDSNLQLRVLAKVLAVLAPHKINDLLRPKTSPTAAKRAQSGPKEQRTDNR